LVVRFGSRAVLRAGAGAGVDAVDVDGAAVDAERGVDRSGRQQRMWLWTRLQWGQQTKNLMFYVKKIQKKKF
jgi:hypothetical protein